MWDTWFFAQIYVWLGFTSGSFLLMFLFSLCVYWLCYIKPKFSLVLLIKNISACKLLFHSRFFFRMSLLSVVKVHFYLIRYLNPKNLLWIPSNFFFNSHYAFLRHLELQMWLFQIRTFLTKKKNFFNQVRFLNDVFFKQLPLSSFIAHILLFWQLNSVTASDSYVPISMWSSLSGVSLESNSLTGTNSNIFFIL